MKINSTLLAVIINLLICNYTFAQGKTTVSIEENRFLINGELTYKGRYWNNHKIEGLLFNSRMVQGIFDDANPETRKQFHYPDTDKWDPNRNTNEFIDAMQDWYDHGLLAFTLNLQGGSPIGYGNKDWRNSTFKADGGLDKKFLKRLDKILKKADELGMVVILGYFYFGQDEYLADEKAILNATDLITDWILKKGYKNILIEVNNECNVKKYDHEILKADNIHRLIDRVSKRASERGEKLLVGTSYGGGSIPKPNVVGISDFILIHGNGVKEHERITEMVEQTKAVKGYSGQPILFNEDDHYDFDKENNNMVAATKAYVSWGFFDFRRNDEPFEEGFQTVPVDWKISSGRKKAFFNKVKEITGK